jgi:uncharacterized protein YceK
MKKILAICFCLLASGCATSITLSEPQTRNKIFSGTVRNFELKCAHGTCLDFPFSLVADVVVLPYTIPKTIINFSKSENTNQLKNDENKQKTTEHETK